MNDRLNWYVPCYFVNICLHRNLNKIKIVKHRCRIQSLNKLLILLTVPLRLCKNYNDSLQFFSVSFIFRYLANNRLLISQSISLNNYLRYSNHFADILKHVPEHVRYLKSVMPERALQLQISRKRRQLAKQGSSTQREVQLHVNAFKYYQTFIPTVFSILIVSAREI